MKIMPYTIYSNIHPILFTTTIPSSSPFPSLFPREYGKVVLSAECKERPVKLKNNEVLSKEYLS